MVTDRRRWPEVDLHVVSGKGGTGKTTVAASLALALARGGRRTLLVEVEGRQGIAQLFDTPPLPYEERMVAVAPDGGEVWALALDPQEALLDYLATFYNMRRAGSALRRMGAIDFATTLAPGLRDVLLTGKVVEVVRRSDKGAADRYDAVVMDAPPTGRITRFLNVNAQMSGLARAGPIRHHADLVMGVIASPRTVVHLVTILEEMPVQETIDAVGDLRAVGLTPGAVIVNLTRPTVLDPARLADARAGRLPVDAIAGALRRAGLDAQADAVASALVAHAADHAHRVDLEERESARVRALGLPTLVLPTLADGVDLGGLYDLAEVLTEGGLG